MSQLLLPLRLRYLNAVRLVPRTLRNERQDVAWLVSAYDENINLGKVVRGRMTCNSHFQFQQFTLIITKRGTHT